MRSERVFAYGSLVAAGGPTAVLPGSRRTWGVAMDNAVALPGYKRYRTAAGAYPDVRVAFLDLVADSGCEVDGTVLTVDAAGLAALDARERNYARAAVTLADGLRAWTYLGTPEGRARAGRAPVVVARAYRDGVRAAFAALGDAALAAFDASTDPAPPLSDLTREDT